MQPETLAQWLPRKGNEREAVHYLPIWLVGEQRPLLSARGSALQTVAPRYHTFIIPHAFAFSFPAYLLSELCLAHFAVDKQTFIKFVFVVKVIGWACVALYHWYRACWILRTHQRVLMETEDKLFRWESHLPRHLGCYCGNKDAMATVTEVTEETTVTVETALHWAIFEARSIFDRCVCAWKSPVFSCLTCVSHR